MYMFYIVSSSYLLVFAMIVYCITREQMMLQVDLVRHSIEEGLAGKSFMEFNFIFCYGFE